MEEQRRAHMRARDRSIARCDRDHADPTTVQIGDKNCACALALRMQASPWRRAGMASNAMLSRS